MKPPLAGSDPDPVRSVRHPLAVQIRKILNRPQTARRMGLFLLDGVHLCEEALNSSHRPHAVLHAPRLTCTAAGRALHEQMAARRWPLVPASDELVDRLAPTETPQGVLALFHRPQEAPETALPRGPITPVERDTLALLLAGVQDPGNAGALARTAHALGSRLLITTSGSVDPLHVRALRASAGALLRMRLAPGLEPDALDRWRAEHAGLLIALDPRRGRALADLRASLAGRGARPVLVLGAEGTGIPPAVDALCEERAHIPMHAEVESLGVLAAGTIALYEWNRPA